MNDKIKQIWEKAATASAAYPSGQNSSWETQVNFMEKFAELIVREMLDIFDKRAEPGTGFYEPQEPAEMIREHFGVEE